MTVSNNKNDFDVSNNKNSNTVTRRPSKKPTFVPLQP